MITLARLGQGRTVHAVHYRPDLPGRWRSVCGKARSNNINFRPSTGIPGCSYCRGKLLDAASDLKIRMKES